MKFCEELLRSYGINTCNFVAVSDIPAFCLDNKLPTTSNIELVTVHLSPDQGGSGFKAWAGTLFHVLGQDTTFTVPLST